jgi:Zn-dependent peptidase ImmA (M78 family)
MSLLFIGIFRYNAKMDDKSLILEKAIESGREKGYVDVVKIANDLDISVFTTQGDDDFNARIVYDRDVNKFKLYVNENHNVERQRFSVAHELAHFILHKAELRELGKLNREGDSVIEEQADKLAAEILIPKELVSRFFSSEGLDSDILNKKMVLSVANKFRVSKSMAVVRLRELDYYVPFIQFS